MMSQRNLVLYIASSLDGYIATEDHNLDWILRAEGDGDNGYSMFYDTIDTVLMGRVTYDWIIEHENGNFPYKDRKCYVFSRTKKDDDEYVTFIHEDIDKFIKSLKDKDGKNIWIVGGGELLYSLLKEKLVDELIVSITPILLGKGISLFKNNDFQTLLFLKSANCFNQFVQLRYEVIKNQ